jgi:hypothetical protein
MEKREKKDGGKGDGGSCGEGECIHVYDTHLMKSCTGDSPNEVLYRRLLRQLYEVAHMVYNHPGHVFRIIQVLTLKSCKPKI